MLEGLDQIDWGAYGKHIYGPAADIPQKIRDLLADDEITRLTAEDHLVGVQETLGTITTATPMFVPFMIELLRYDKTPSKEEILACLLALAREIDEPWSRLTTVDSQQLYRQTYDAIEAGVDTYLIFLENENPGIQERINELLSYLSGK